MTDQGTYFDSLVEHFATFGGIPVRPPSTPDQRQQVAQDLVESLT